MTKVVTAALVCIFTAAIYGFSFGLESWSDEQSWYMLALVGAVLAVWALGVWINRNESIKK